MANLVGGKLPPPEGMTYQQFLDYSMYIALREFIRVYNGAEEARQFDAAYRNGRQINQTTVADHPLGKMIAELGAAMHGGAVMFGWDNASGKMDWNVFARIMRWYAQLPTRTKATALRRVKEGSETPWQATSQEQQSFQRTASSQNQVQQEVMSTDMALRYGEQNQPAEKPTENNGLSTLSWVLIAALIVGAGFLLYKTFSKEPETAAENPAPDPKQEVKQLPEAASTQEQQQETAAEEEDPS